MSLSINRWKLISWCSYHLEEVGENSWTHPTQGWDAGDFLVASISLVSIHQPKTTTSGPVACHRQQRAAVLSSSFTRIECWSTTKRWYLKMLAKDLVNRKQPVWRCKTSSLGPRRCGEDLRNQRGRMPVLESCRRWSLDWEVEQNVSLRPWKAALHQKQTWTSFCEGYGGMDF